MWILIKEIDINSGRVRILIALEKFLRTSSSFFPFFSNNNRPDFYFYFRTFFPFLLSSIRVENRYRIPNA
jgi:hypothetical protein